MDSRLIQRTRYVLRSRVRRAQKCHVYLFESACLHLLAWLDNHPVLSSVVRNLETTENQLKDTITEQLGQPGSGKLFPELGITYKADSTEAHAAICLHIVRAASVADQYSGNKGMEILSMLSNYLTKSRTTDIGEIVESIRDIAIDGLYEYLDEHVDTRNIIWSLLLKYKQRCEWFHRARLRSVADEGLERVKGERGLAVDLQEYVFDQGVEFFIESTSSSGEADLILRDPEGRYLVIDAKYIREGASRSKALSQIRDGFHQVYRYCNDFNEPEGFLVAFYRCTTRIRLDLEEEDSLPFLNIGGRIIYFLDVHISDEPSASKSGQADEYSFNREELITAVEK